MDKIKEPDWCSVCGYNLDVSGNCFNCEQEKEKDKMYQKQRKEALIRDLGGLMAYEKYTEDKFLNKKILSECKEFPNINLFIYGSVGSGKTHLGTALIRRCNFFNRIKPMQIFRAVRKCETAIQEERVIENLCEKPLMIDDLGTEKLTEFAFQVIYEIIDGRYENAKKGLIITSNYGLKGLSTRFSNKNIESRLKSMCKVIEMTGKDFRLKETKK